MFLILGPFSTSVRWHVMVFPRSDSFNGNDFTFGEPPWRSAKLLISDGAASSSGEEVIRHFFPLVAAVVVPVADDGRWCQVQRFLQS